MSQSNQTSQPLRSFRIAPSSFDEMKTERGGKLVLLGFLVVNVVLGCYIGIKTSGAWGWLPILAAWAAIICVPHLSILLHELGHAIAARALGVRVFAVQFGMGTVVFCRKWQGIAWEMRRVPFCGLATCGHTTRKWFRTKQMLMVAAGPAFTLVAFVAGICFFFLHSSPTEKSSLSPCEAATMLGYVVVWTQGSILLGTLWPHKSAIYGRARPSDGLQLWRTPFMKEAEIEESLATTYAQEGDLMVKAGKLDEGLACFRSGLDKHPSSWLLQYCCGLCCRDKKMAKDSVDYFTKALESKSLPALVRAQILKELARLR